MIKPDGSRQLLPTKIFTHLQQGDRLQIETPGGGGWGDPSERDRDLLEQDVAEGLISPERAREVYGYDPAVSGTDGAGPTRLGRTK